MIVASTRVERPQAPRMLETSLGASVLRSVAAWRRVRVEADEQIADRVGREMLFLRRTRGRPVRDTDPAHVETIVPGNVDRLPDAGENSTARAYRRRGATRTAARSFVSSAAQPTALLARLGHWALSSARNTPRIGLVGEYLAHEGRFVGDLEGPVAPRS
jgi:hypothetical protein